MEFRTSRRTCWASRARNVRFKNFDDVDGEISVKKSDIQLQSRIMYNNNCCSSHVVKQLYRRMCIRLRDAPTTGQGDCGGWAARHWAACSALRGSKPASGASSASSADPARPDECASEAIVAMSAFTQLTVR